MRTFAGRALPPLRCAHPPPKGVCGPELETLPWEPPGEGDIERLPGLFCGTGLKFKCQQVLINPLASSPLLVRSHDLAESPKVDQVFGGYAKQASKSRANSLTLVKAGSLCICFTGQSPKHKHHRG